MSSIVFQQKLDGGLILQSTGYTPWLSTLDHIILSVSQPLVMMALGSKKLDDTTPEILEQMIH